MIFRCSLLDRFSVQIVKNYDGQLAILLSEPKKLGEPKKGTIKFPICQKFEHLSTNFSKIF